MNKKGLDLRIAAVLAAAASGGLSGYTRAADVESGRAEFQLCQACHATKTGETSIGPTLAGVMGRRAGSLPSYDYSPAMKAAGARGIIWDRKTLDVYLSNPSSYMPGIKMAFPGIPDPLDRQDLIDYLSTLNAKK